MSSTISVVITGSSRPQLLPYFINSFKKMCFFREKPQIIFSEDFVFKNESSQVLQYLHDNEPDISLIWHDPAIGLGHTLDHLIRVIIETDYIFYSQEDFEYERPIDIDQMIYIMDQNPNINCISFNKSINYPTLNGEEQKQYTYNDADFCIYHQWTFLPGIWRMSKVREKWRVKKEAHQRSEGYFTNAFGTQEQRKSVEYCEQNLGVYMLGAQNDYRYVRHIGNDWRTEKWRLENGQPGGVQDAAIMDLPHMAPWITLEDRPTRKQFHTPEDLERALKDEPVEFLQAAGLK